MFQNVGAARPHSVNTGYWNKTWLYSTSQGLGCTQALKVTHSSIFSALVWQGFQTEGQSLPTSLSTTVSIDDTRDMWRSRIQLPLGRVFTVSQINHLAELLHVRLGWCGPASTWKCAIRLSVAASVIALIQSFTCMPVQRPWLFVFIFHISPSGDI